MSELKPLICPVCGSNNLYIKYQATYVYSYSLDSDAPGSNNTAAFLPYLYDNREQTDARQSIECSNCKTEFQCLYDQWNKEMDARNLQEALDTEYHKQLEHS